MHAVQQVNANKIVLFAFAADKSVNVKEADTASFNN